jgi:hypothetical protein
MSNSEIFNELINLPITAVGRGSDNRIVTDSHRVAGRIGIQANVSGTARGMWCLSTNQIYFEGQDRTLDLYTNRTW